MLSFTYFCLMTEKGVLKIQLNAVNTSFHC